MSSCMCRSVEFWMKDSSTVFFPLYAFASCFLSWLEFPALYWIKRWPQTSLLILDSGGGRISFTSSHSPFNFPFLSPAPSLPASDHWLSAGHPSRKVKLHHCLLYTSASLCCTSPFPLQSPDQLSHREADHSTPSHKGMDNSSFHYSSKCIYLASVQARQKGIMWGTLSYFIVMRKKRTLVICVWHTSETHRGSEHKLI